VFALRPLSSRWRLRAYRGPRGGGPWVDGISQGFWPFVLPAFEA
jgi:hypothetical protein